MLLFQVVMDMENKSSVTAYPIFGFYSICFEKNYYLEIKFFMMPLYKSIFNKKNLRRIFFETSLPDCVHFYLTTSV